MTSYAEGYYYTSGNQIVDHAGSPVRLQSVSWFGFEGGDGVIDGLWMSRSYTDYLDQIKSLGFNSVRLPFASESLGYTPNTTDPNGSNYTYLSSENADFLGKTTLEMMDLLIDYAASIDLMIVLDHHRMSLGVGTENGLWYDNSWTVDDWVSGWEMLADRYADKTHVVGADLQNEPYQGVWGGQGETDWVAAAERAGNAILDVNPNWLIFVEGVQTYDGQNYWWGGNLQGVADLPVNLDMANKVVYSPHDYPSSVSSQPWFSDPSYPSNLPGVWDDYWGYVYRQAIAPVWVGEFGTKLQTVSDEQWLDSITAYMNGDYDNDGTSDIPNNERGMSWSYFGWGPNSGDTGGILQDDWITVNTDKTAYLFTSPLPNPSTDRGSGSSGWQSAVDDWPADESVVWQVSFRDAPDAAIGLLGQDVDPQGGQLAPFIHLGLALGTVNGIAPGFSPTDFLAEIASSVVDGSVALSAYLYGSQTTLDLDLVQTGENQYTLRAGETDYADMGLATVSQSNAISWVQQVTPSTPGDLVFAIPLGLISDETNVVQTDPESFSLSFLATLSRSAEWDGSFGLYLGDLSTGNPIDPLTGAVMSLQDLRPDNLSQFSVYQATAIADGQELEESFSILVSAQPELDQLGLFPYYELSEQAGGLLYAGGLPASDGVAHIVRAGANTFGVEDMIGGDYDFNDWLVHVAVI
jgi:aryl-phospho-beta-D-glucosidase BglC (GH1 family)